MSRRADIIREVIVWVVIVATIIVVIFVSTMSRSEPQRCDDRGGEWIDEGDIVYLSGSPFTVTRAGCRMSAATP